MEKLVRFYYKNRIRVWAFILAIVFIIIIIHLFNLIIGQQDQEDENNVQNNIAVNESKRILYDKSGESIVSADNVPDTYKDKFASLIDEFLGYCTQHNPEKAYKLLSNECKQELYPTQEIFESRYYDEKFKNSNKTYTFQSWISDGSYIYQIKIFEDRLSDAIGQVTYVEDYYRIVKEDDSSLKLNIGGYLAKKDINRKVEKDNITILVKNIDIYMDYKIGEITIYNNTNETIMLDTRKDTKTVYLMNSSNNKIYALLYENDEEDFIIEKGKMKTIYIKFNSSFKSDNSINGIVFEDIVMDYNKYINSDESYEDRVQIEVGL